MSIFRSISGEQLADIGKAPLPPLHERVIIPAGDAGTAETIKIMQQLVASGKRNDNVRKVCGDILTGKIAGIPKQNPKDYQGYAKALYTFCRDKILYAYDPHLVEYVESADRVLKNGIADCDSVCVLLSAMLQNIGLETQFVTIKADPTRKDEYSHVYLRVKIPGKGWIACDPIMPRHEFGWEAPTHFGKRYWHGSTDELSFPLDQKASLPMSGMKGMGEEPGFFDWLFGTDSGGEELPKDILPGPVNPNYQQFTPAQPAGGTCPVGQIPIWTAGMPPRFGGCRPMPVVGQKYPPATSSCQTFADQRKAYQQAALLASRNFNACRTGKPITASFAMAGLEALKPGAMNRPMSPTMRRPKKPGTRRPRPTIAMAGLGCGACAATPVMAGMGCGPCGTTVMAGLGCGDKPCGPCAAKKAAQGVAGLGAEVDQTIMGFFNGQTKSDLLALKSKIDQQGRDLDALYKDIQKITDPSQKQSALKAYDTASRALGTAFSKFNAVRSQYNDAMGKVMNYASTLPGIDKSMFPGLAGMGAVQLPVAIIVGIVATLSLGYTISQITNGIAVVKGDINASRGYIDQLANLAEKTGGLLESFGRTIKTVSGAASDTAWTALQIGAVAGIGYLIYQNRAVIGDVLKGRA